MSESTPTAPMGTTEPEDTTEAGLWTDAWVELKKNRIFVVSASAMLLLLIMAVFPKLFLFFYPGQTDPTVCDLLSHSANVPGQGRPSSGAWFGYDIQGCDYYTRTILGARISIFTGILVTFGAATLAVIGGSIAGYYGGIWDSIIARITDIWFAVPTVLGAIVLLTSMFSTRGVPQVMFVLVFLGWPSMLRLMRSSVLSNKEQDFVAASRALGGSDFRVITRHILPNAMAPVLVYATITVGVIISAEAALSFLGVGNQLPAISWGLMIQTGSGRLLNAPHLLFFPGVLLSITVLSFIMMGDALRDALDPKIR